MSGLEQKKRRYFSTSFPFGTAVRRRRAQRLYLHILLKISTGVGWANKVSESLLKTGKNPAIHTAAALVSLVRALGGSHGI